MPKTIEQQVIATYFSLRLGLVVIALVFPILLWAGGTFYVGVPLQASMSAYYHVAMDGRSMRDWFVGTLFAVGVLLYLYKGYSNKENIALNIAGVMAVGIAIFPMPWNCPDCGYLSIHGACAVSFFLCIAFVCEFCSSDTLRLIRDNNVRSRYRRVYHLLAAAMLLSPVAAFVFNAISLQHNLVFWVEVFGIYAFAAYWFTKSKEFAMTQAEKRAVRGELDAELAQP